MYVDVPHLDCLLVAAPITLEGLDQVILKPKQLDGVVAVNVDEVLGHVAMALSKKSQAGYAPGGIDISGPQGKSEDQPHAKQIVPAEGVTPPAEVHACPTVHSAPCTTRYRCLPTGVTGSRSRPTPPGFGQIVLCRPDAWVRVSFAHTRVSIDRRAKTDRLAPSCSNAPFSA